ncbi:flavodoxin family protein [Jannaschia aquimarina]|uniref:PnpB protein n=1 Tax=Jannaschia aquimarina TaxID=935700 RepID=A0A0D1DA96_9RHOB|nr:flavodoxin family protein [Jannaschia aquimarina]KIT16808.1 p-benzoquinone reductase [Jannaschia aquimarina]SNT13780.1 NAD(P)H dehydrogenase (quinone) [Jannaschia aquimarina]
MAKIAIVYHSGYGHTKKQALAVAEGARAGGAEVDVLEADALGDPEGDDWAPLDAADAIIFGSPTYMGSVSGPFESFVDKTSKKWFTQAWHGKIGAGFTCSSSFHGSKQVTLQRLCELAMQHGMIWVGPGLMPTEPTHPDTDKDGNNRLGFYLGAAAQAGQNASPEEAPTNGDLANAHALGKRVAEVAARMG